MTNRFKGLDLIDRVSEELWTEVCKRGSDQDHPQGKKCKKAKWLSEEALQTAEKRKEAKGKGEQERYTHLNAAAIAAKSLQSCPTLCNPIDGSPPGSPVPGILQASNTGVGCHFLLQCVKVKSKSEVAQLCPTVSDPMDCSPPGFSVRGIFQARVLEWGATAFSSECSCYCC